MYIIGYCAQELNLFLERIHWKYCTNVLEGT